MVKRGLVTPQVLATDSAPFVLASSALHIELCKRNKYFQVGVLDGVWALVYCWLRRNNRDIVSPRDA